MSNEKRYSIVFQHLAVFQFGLLLSSKRIAVTKHHQKMNQVLLAVLVISASVILTSWAETDPKANRQISRGRSPQQHDNHRTFDHSEGKYYRLVAREGLAMDESQVDEVLPGDLAPAETGSTNETLIVDDTGSNRCGLTTCSPPVTIPTRPPPYPTPTPPHPTYPTPTPTPPYPTWPTPTPPHPTWPTPTPPHPTYPTPTPPYPTWPTPTPPHPTWPTPTPPHPTYPTPTPPYPTWPTPTPPHPTWPTNPPTPHPTWPTNPPTPPPHPCGTTPPPIITHPTLPSITYTTNCDYCDHDLYTLTCIRTAFDCAARCAGEWKCTHFTYIANLNGGTCRLKRAVGSGGAWFSLIPAPSAYVCGYIPKRAYTKILLDICFGVEITNSIGYHK